MSGAKPARSVAPNAVELMAERGIDISHHVATQLGEVVTIYPVTRDKSFLLGDFAVGQQVDITDAWGQPMSVYQQALAQIDQYVPAALTKTHAEQLNPPTCH
jgi:protein-tyrosine-phosphatase